MTWPALDARSHQSELLLAAVDDFSPTAVEERDSGLRVFFATPTARDAAVSALGRQFSVTAVDVDDEDWARRSQEDLSPITVGRITIVPGPESRAPSTGSVIVIPPSMGFGTGHHATTRLCLAALQSIDLRDAFVLDVGTGSGILAIAAAALGAGRALGMDDDADAIAAAKENLELNRVANVTFEVGDLMTGQLPAADVVVANLTGAMLVRAAARLMEAVRPGGVLIVSGIMATEGDEVRRAFANRRFDADVQEDEWLAFTIRS